MKLRILKLIAYWLVTAGLVAGIWHEMSPMIARFLAMPNPGFFNAYLPALIVTLAMILMMGHASIISAAMCDTASPREDRRH